MSEALIAELIEAGTPASLVAKVAMALGRAEADQAAISARREADRVRKEKSRHVTSQEVTPSHVTSRDKGDAPAPAQPEPTNLSKQDILPKSPPMGGQKGKVSAARRTRIASDAQPSGADRKSADDAGMTPSTFRAEWGLFRDRHVAEATSMADWHAAWRTWVGKWIKYGCKQHGITANGARGSPSNNLKSGNNSFDAARNLLEDDYRSRHEQSSSPGPDWDGPKIDASAYALPYQ